MGLGNLVGDFGLATALIQQPNITTKDVRYLFTIQVLIGLVMTIFVILISPWVALFFKSPDATMVIQSFACIFLFKAIGITSTSLLRRQLDFKRLQIYNIASYLLSYLMLGIPLALTGHGVWSLVAAQVSQALIYSIMVNFHIRHSWKLSLEADAKGMLTFGIKIMISNLTSWGITNLDSVFIGRVFGPISLGLYNRGMALVTLPMSAFTSTLQGVLFPAYARMNNNIEKSKSAYLASVGLAMLILMPFFAAVAVIPHTLIAAIYGNKWLEVVGLITPLALAMPVNSTLAMSGPLLTGLGKAGLDAFSQGVCFAILLPAVWVSSNISLGAVAWTVLAVSLLRAIFLVYLVMRLVNARMHEVLKTLMGPIILSCIAAVFAAFLDVILSDLNPMVRIFIVLGGSATATVIILLLQAKNFLCSETRFVLLKIASTLPKPVSLYFKGWSL
jgi:PST family polysaccharide transporter